MNMRHRLPLMVVPQEHRLQVKPKLVQDHLPSLAIRKKRSLASPQSEGSSSETSSTSGEDSSDSSSEDDGGQEK